MMDDKSIRTKTSGNRFVFFSKNTSGILHEGGEGGALFPYRHLSAGGDTITNSVTFAVMERVDGKVQRGQMGQQLSCLQEYTSQVQVKYT